MRGGRRVSTAVANHAPADLQRYFIVKRAGVRLLVGNAQLRQRFENHVGLYFKLAGQLINANFTHTIAFRRRKIRDERMFTKVRLLLLRFPVRRPELPCSLSYQIRFQAPFHPMPQQQFRMPAKLIHRFRPGLLLSGQFLAGLFQ
jgi:hypothetical protein